MSPLEALAAQSGGDGGASRPIITITEAALAKLIELRADEADADQLGLRLAIASGPGEDFRYDLSFDEYLKAAFTDEVRTHEGGEGSTIKVIIPATTSSAARRHARLHRLAGPRHPQPEPSGSADVEGLVRDDELSAEIEAMVAAEVNPALAAHGGFVTYVGHDGEGTVYMTMGGGCHGCSMSKMTMLEGVQTMLSEAIPAVERSLHGPHRPQHRREPLLQLTAVVLADDGATATIPGEGSSITLTGVSSFELTRSRLGRRTADQVRSWNWSEPLTDDEMATWFVFGPAEVPIDE
jgi:Fe/S biogenesis protein NfuA